MPGSQSQTCVVQGPTVADRHHRRGADRPLLDYCTAARLLAEGHRVMVVVAAAAMPRRLRCR